MKILIVALYDDNYGDMLIRICFRQLLKVALKQAGVGEDSVDIIQMDLEDQDTEAIRSSDVIMFAGGGLFGLSYLGFAPYVESILDTADEHDIPVVFSSLGINNMDAKDSDEDRLISVMRHKCIKYFSARENIELFSRYAKGTSYHITSVCDPVVWAREVFNVRREEHYTKVIGINAVRGGLFKSNGGEWTLDDQLNYIKNTIESLTSSGYDYKVYTNGSFLDNNTLYQLGALCDIPDDKLIKVRSSRELIDVIASFDAVCAIRMHSSIISYSLEVPCINIVWNDKVPLFYKAIGYDDRAISIDELYDKPISDRIDTVLKDGVSSSAEYKMSLYRYIQDVMAGLFDLRYEDDISYEDVVKELISISELSYTAYDSLIDAKYYTRRSERSYASLFDKDRNKSESIRTLKERHAKQKENYTAKISKLNEKNIRQQEKIEALRDRVARRDARIEKKDIKIEEKNIQIEKLKKELDELNKTIPVRAMKKIKRITKGGQS